MRKIILFSGVLPWIALLAGCPKKGGDGADAAAEAAAVVEASAPDDATAAAPVGAAAKNTGDVARFPAETKFDNEPARVLVGVLARTAPKGGNVITTIRGNTDVNKVAEYQDWFLIVFPDPKDASTNLMGWIPKEVFNPPAVVVDAGITDAGITDSGIKDAATKDAAVDAGTVDAGKPATTLKCAANQEAVNGFGKDPVCKKKCTADKDCKGAAAGSCATAASVAGKVVRVCKNE